MKWFQLRRNCMLAYDGSTTGSPLSVLFNLQLCLPRNYISVMDDSSLHVCYASPTPTPSGGFQVSSSLCYWFLHMTRLHYMGVEVESETLNWTLHFHSQFQVLGVDWLLDFSNVGCDYKFKEEICGFSISCCGCGLATQFIKRWV